MCIGLHGQHSTAPTAPSTATNSATSCSIAIKSMSVVFTTQCEESLWKGLDAESLSRIQLSQEKYIHVNEYFLVGLASLYSGKRLKPTDIAAKLNWTGKFPSNSDAVARMIVQSIVACRKKCEGAKSGKKLPASVLKVAPSALHANGARWFRTLATGIS